MTDDCIIFKIILFVKFYSSLTMLLVKGKTSLILWKKNMVCRSLYFSFPRCIINSKLCFKIKFWFGNFNSSTLNSNLVFKLLIFAWYFLLLLWKRGGKGTSWCRVLECLTSPYFLSVASPTRVRRSVCCGSDYASGCYC